MKLPKEISLNKEFMDEAVEALRKNPALLLHIPTLLKKEVQLRLDKVKEEDFECVEGEDVRSHTLKHNLSQLKKMEAWSRPQRLIWPLMGIDVIHTNLKHLKVLTIGPRSEAEIFLLIASGFNPDNITGIDLLSYSDYIDTGDAHELPYEDSSFDVVIAGWVFAYSDNNQKLANEIIRVAGPGSFISIGCRTEVLERELAHKVMGQVGGHPIQFKHPDGTLSAVASRFMRTEQIYRLFGEHIGNIYYNHNPHPSLEGKEQSDVITVFSLREELPDAG
jgi:hypothetical protein